MGTDTAFWAENTCMTVLSCSCLGSSRGAQFQEVLSLLIRKSFKTLQSVRENVHEGVLGPLCKSLKAHKTTL